MVGPPTDNPGGITLSPENFARLWEFVGSTEATLTRVNARLDDGDEKLEDHGDRLIQLERRGSVQQSWFEFGRWLAPMLISIGALGAVLWQVL